MEHKTLFTNRFAGRPSGKSLFLATVLTLLFGSAQAFPPITGVMVAGVGSTTALQNVVPGGLWTSANTSVANIGSLSGVVDGISAGTSSITYTYSGTSVYTTVTVVAGYCTPIITTLAGKGTSGYSGDGSAATAAELSDPYSVTADAAGNVYIADRGNNRVRKVSPLGVISTLAGSGTAGFAGDGGTATAAQLNKPTGVACDASGNVYIADQLNHRVRKVNSSGTITTFAGNSSAGYSGDGGAATAATLDQPINVATDNLGNVYIVDFGNSTIRKVNTSGVITTVAGTGTAGFSGDGGPATAAKIYRPTQAALDAAGNLFICDENNGRIRKVDVTGTITTICGIGGDGYVGDGGPATSAQLNEPWGVAIDPCGNVYIADQVNSRIRVIDGAGIITTYAGNGVRGALGDYGPATAAEIYNAYGIFIDNAGNMYIADNINAKVRKVTSCGCGTLPAISGPATVCIGNTVTLSNSATGGIWSSGNTAVATIGSSTGVITGISAGTAVITYSVSGSFTTTVISVNNGVAPITGGNIVAVTGTVILASATTGGKWISSDSTVVRVCDPCGYVIGESAGTATITYTAGGCYTIHPMTVITLGAISGTALLCTGSSLTLSSSTPGGSWISSNAGIATIGLSSGVLTGVAVGNATISYKLYGAVITASVVVQPMPAAISGPSVVTTGGSVTLSNATAGGTWISSAVAIATVGSLSGSVNGVATGSATISYSLGACAATLPIVVIPVEPITGPGVVCAGATITLSNATIGGVWNSSNISIATVNSSTGVVTGVAAGSATISYTAAGYTRTAVVTVNSAPVAGTISGSGAIPVGGTSPLNGFGVNGTVSWSSSNTAIATVDVNGVVSGIAYGTAVITYTLTNDCGSDFATKYITVYSGISGSIAVCPGSSTILTGNVPGGTWSSSNTSVAVINSVTGLLTGVTSGTAEITYHTSSPAVVTVTVLPSPVVTGTVTNPTCHGYSNGHIEIETTGGSTSGSWLYYSYSWSNGATTNGAWGLCAGTYSVVATDPNGCTGAASFTVTQPDPITTTGLITDTILNCNVGMIELTVSGGTNPYSYVWSNGETTQNIYGLLEGEYFVEVTDQNGCQATGWYYVEYCIGCIQNGMRRSGPGGGPWVPPVVPPTGAKTAVNKAFPNPFVSSTTISFTGAKGNTTVEVINAVNGQKMGTIFNQQTEGGTEYTCVLNGSDMPAGMYIYNIVCGKSTQTGKVILMK